nr:helix-turn-helix domain-containing protein [Halarchaeum rubridurum]
MRGVLHEASGVRVVSDDLEAEDFREQAKVFKALQSEVRLKLLKEVSERQPVSAPELHDAFEVTKESIKKNLNQLEEAGLLRSSRERGPGNRPRDEFVLAYGESGVMVQLDVVPDDYDFYLGESDVASPL